MDTETPLTGSSSLITPAVQPNILTSPVQPAITQQNTTTPFEYAGFGRRMGASIIDGFILLIINLSIGFSFGAGGIKNGGIANLISLFINIGYTIFFWVKQNGQTLGKRAMAIRIIKENGQPPDISVAVIRYIGYMISSIVLFVGFIWVLFDSKKQGWHDKIAKTYVVKTGDKPKTWLVFVCLILPFLSILVFSLVIGMLVASGKLSQAQFMQLYSPLMNKTLLEKNTRQAIDSLTMNRIFDQTAIAVANFRKEHSLPAFEVDNRLCAYAKRRLEQLSKLENDLNDAGRGFYEDTANPNIWSAYFTEYNKVFANDHPLQYSLTGGEIVSDWTKNENNNLSNKDITHACIQVDATSVVLVAGIKKK